uniref:Uncharacterized protein n=1 Tax=Cacopsylla melanoneura TaxID=428564 RepID=A0A8D8V2E4_9HEMI
MRSDNVRLSRNQCPSIVTHAPRHSAASTRSVRLSTARPSAPVCLATSAPLSPQAVVSSASSIRTVRAIAHASTTSASTRAQTVRAVIVRSVTSSIIRLCVRVRRRYKGIRSCCARKCRKNHVIRAIPHHAVRTACAGSSTVYPPARTPSASSIRIVHAIAPASISGVAILARDRAV